MYTFEYQVDLTKLEDTIKADSLAAAWIEFWKRHPQAENVKCFNEHLFLATDASYPGPAQAVTLNIKRHPGMDRMSDAELKGKILRLLKDFEYGIVTIE